MGQSAEQMSKEHISKSSFSQDPVVAHELVIMEGDARECLPKAAKEKGAALMVVGTHGHGSLKEVLLGSTAQHLSHHAGVPIVIVNVVRV
jgi:nucleotide-binding universal stress UspA family protein